MYIKEIELYSANIKRLRDFYIHTMNFSLQESDHKSFSIPVGDTLMKFAYKQDSHPYHFAFNIPHNQVHNAVAWLKQRVDILTFNNLDIVDFSSWNAEAIYFYDPDMNIVEFIARKNLGITSDYNFIQDQIFELSEIGLVTNDIEAIFNQLHRELNLKVYDGTFDKFCAIGDEHGLFITINKNRKEWFPGNDKAFYTDFKAIIETGGENYHLSYLNRLLTISPCN